MAEIRAAVPATAPSVATVRIHILADDMIWADRLIRAVRAVPAEPVAVRALAALETGIAAGDAVIVDLTARAYDGIDAVARAAARGARVLAVGQHDDHALRRRALDAGADRVLAYRKLAEDGPATIAAWLARSGGRR